MSAMALDKPLDDMIAANPTTRSGKPKGNRNDKRRKPNHKASIVGSNNNLKQAARKVSAAGNGSNKNATFDEMMPTAKIMVSNLPSDVTDEQVRELFNKTIGSTKEVLLFFDSKHKATGRASVTFRNEAHGKAAWKAYNGRVIDSTKPMIVELIYESNIPGGSLAARLSAPKREAKENNQPQTNTKNRTQNAGAAGRGQKKVKRTPKTVEDLDAEMAEYAAVPNN